MVFNHLTSGNTGVQVQNIGLLLCYLEIGWKPSVDAFHLFPEIQMTKGILTTHVLWMSDPDHSTLVTSVRIRILGLVSGLG